MIDLNDPNVTTLYIWGDNPPGRALFNTQTFTRSNGTLFARVYERLTKASRRRYDRIPGPKDIVFQRERSYRRGVRDTLEALRAELS